MSNKFYKMLPKAFGLDKKYDNNLIAQWEALDSLYNRQDLLDENDQKDIKECARK